MKKRLRKKFSARYVTLVLTNKRYGGPEEGGWWYNEHVPLETVSKSRSKQAIKRWKKSYPEIGSGKDSEGNPLSSVLCEGILTVYITSTPVEETKRPYYC